MVNRLIEREPTVRNLAKGSPHLYRWGEDVTLNTEPQDGVLRATIDSSVFLGINTHYFLHTKKGEPIEVIQESLIDQTILDGTKVWLTVKKREDQCL